jgi:hypothetical protein
VKRGPGNLEVNVDIADVASNVGRTGYHIAQEATCAVVLDIDGEEDVVLRGGGP